jgi:hypothetical protein
VSGLLAAVSPPPVSPPDAGTLSAAAGVMLLLVWAGWLVWVVAEIARGRVARGRLVLTPDGVYHRNPRAGDTATTLRSSTPCRGTR